MIRTVAVLTAAAALGCAGPGSGPAVAPYPAAGAASDALHARSAGLQQAEAALDADRALAFWAEDGVIQAGGSPQVNGRAAIGALYRLYFTSLGVRELAGTPAGLTMAQSGDLAYETGVNRIVLRANGGDLLDMGKYLLVWRKIDGQWYAAALSFTSDAAAPRLIAATP
ncbi:nuclear transport factor 2 family protein [Longimicrobium sp.]|uniref:YybH family protein n=1 Tax=Longimicrobium sp. TaxID=2029185 RepID=UPI002CAA485D|nr:nuclear transport factor 2 family protein [Longimicrobium sp.]HSU15791.1 nuclear transport factor 2 family protein [Longimicrobium sp.]